MYDAPEIKFSKDGLARLGEGVSQYIDELEYQHEHYLRDIRTW